MHCKGRGDVTVRSCYRIRVCRSARSRSSLDSADQVVVALGLIVPTMPPTDWVYVVVPGNMKWRVILVTVILIL